MSGRAPANALASAARMRRYAVLGASWLEIPLSRAMGYVEPVGGRGIHSHDLTSRRGKTWSCHPKCPPCGPPLSSGWWRSEEHTSELQSRLHLVCRLLLEKKKKVGPIRGQYLTADCFPLSQCQSGI